MNISEVSKKYNIPTDTLRYYEKEGLIPGVHRRESGIRDYSEEDIGWVYFIKCMRDAGLPIKILQKYISLFHKGDSTREERKNLLIEERDKLSDRIKEMKKTLKYLDHKIKVYETDLKKFEKKLKK